MTELALRTHLRRFSLSAALLLTVFGKCFCQSSVRVDAFVPAEHEVIGEDQYVCFRVDLPKESLKIVGVDPLSTQDVVHHMLLFGCASEGPPNEAWPCHMTSPCRGGFERVLYGWGKNAPAMSLPSGVGYSVGPGSAIQSLVLQVHYLQARPPGDQSGITLRMTRQSTPFSAGMINYAKYFSIPPGKPQHPIENQCCYSGFEILKGFAFRVHTHALGRSVNLERMATKHGQPTSQELCRNDPQLPQGFTPLAQDIAIRPGDTLKATCMFDSSNQTKPVNAGATHNDEMCNLYLMLYSQLPYFMSCYGVSQIERRGTGGVPAEGTLEPDLHEMWKPPPSKDAELPPEATKPSVAFGQISAVCKGHNNDMWVFHRGGVVWDQATFDSKEDGIHMANPNAFIKAPAVLQLNQDTGEVLSSWGSGQFLMPHGLTVAWDGSIWVTDCGLHQVIKFSPKGEQLQTLGIRLEPGHDSYHLCKPTHVVIASDGAIFVADGYCNSRVVRYSAEGVFEAEYKLPRGKMNVPHSLALEECSNSLYVADRENSQVHRFSISDQTLQATWNLLGNVYAITAGPYGTVLALLWAHRGDSALEAVSIVLLTEDSTGGGAEETWRLEGVGSPHDIAVAAAPTPVRGTGDRALALFLTETKPKDSWLRKYLFVPAGSSMAEMVGKGVIEGLQPDTRHGVEAQLALENNASTPNNASIPSILSHRLDVTQQQPHSSADNNTDPHLVNDQAQKDAAQPLPLVKPTTGDPAGADVLHHNDMFHDAHHAVKGPADPLVNSSVHGGHQVHTEQSGQVVNPLVQGGRQAHIGQSGQVVKPLVHGSHQAHTGPAGQVIHENLPGSADPAARFQLGADTGVVGHTLPDSVGMASGLNAEGHGIHNDVHSRNRQELGAAHDGVFGSHSDVLPQTAGYGGLLSQLLSFGVPVACVFVAIAFVLWKRLGASRPLTSSMW